MSAAIPLGYGLTLAVSAYHLKPNSTIAVIGTADAPPSAPAQQAKPTPAPPRSEQSTINQIQSEMQNVRSSLGRDLENLLVSLPQYWNAYQLGLSLRAHQARGIWDRASGRSEGSQVEG